MRIWTPKPLSISWCSNTMFFTIGKHPPKSNMTYLTCKVTDHRWNNGAVLHSIIFDWDFFLGGWFKCISVEQRPQSTRFRPMYEASFSWVLSYHFKHQKKCQTWKVTLPHNLTSFQTFCSFFDVSLLNLFIIKVVTHFIKILLTL